MVIASAAPPPPAAGPPRLSRRQFVLTLVGLLTAMLLAALDQTVVATAMPRIIADLDGFERYTWVSIAYMLTSTAVVPVIGALSDRYGHKVFLMGGVAYFVAMSMLCGVAQDMTQLIVFRGLQGLGGGILFSVIFTVLSVLFPPAQRGKFQGGFSGVFAFASLVGPLVGGYLTDQLSWRWVFYVNLPVGVIALVVLWLAYPREQVTRARRGVDVPGAVTLVAAVVPFLLALTWGGREHAWSSPVILGMLGLAAAMLLLFLRVESRADEPILPLAVLRNRIICVASLGTLLMGMTLFGTVLFVPLFIQGVIGTDATTSGTVVIPMMLSLVAGGILGGQLTSRTGRYRLVGLFGLGTTAVGLYLLSRMGPETDYATVVRNMVIVGLGLGPLSPAFTISAQNAVSYGQLGMVTSITQFARSIGSTAGAALYGSLLSTRFVPAFHAALPPQIAAALPAGELARIEDPQVLLHADAAAAMHAALAPLGPEVFPAAVGAIKVGLATALHDAFLVGTGVAVVGAVAVLFLREIPLQRSYAPAVPDRPRAQEPSPATHLAPTANR